MSGGRAGWLVLGGALLAAGCGKADAAGEVWLPVLRGDLALEAEVTGSLKAVRSAPLGPPGSLENDDFKISDLAAEGGEVKKGAKVMAFDTGEIERELRDRTAERDSAAKEIERRAHELELRRREGELAVVEAEAAAGKARLQAELPPQYTAAVEMKLARIDLEAAEASLGMAKQRLRHTLSMGQAELGFLRERHARFAARVGRLEEAVGKMSVRAPIDGIVVYRTNWRGEKKKIGDPCWVEEPCVEVTDTSEMVALGEVDEMESARVAVGQRARLRLDALPEMEWEGTVESLRPNVYRQSWRNPLKVIGVRVKLTKTDATRMRPGMQFRGRLSTGQVAGVVLAPLEGVFAREGGPVAFRKTATGFERVRVTLGQRSRTQVEVKAGLEAGDRVARRDLEEEVAP